MRVRRHSLVVLSLVALLLPSCSGYHAGQMYRVESERVVAKSFDSVWASLVDFYHINNFSITETDTTTGFVSFYVPSNSVGLDSTFDCGHLASLDGNITSTNLKCNVILKRTSWDSTLVTVKPYETASIHYTEGDRWRTVDCNSTGKFEHRVLDAIAGAPTHFAAERIDTDLADIEIDMEFSGWHLWLGAAMLPFTVRNVRDVHISDWQQHSNCSDEGRLVLPLSELKTSGNHGGGLVALGYDAGAWTPFAEMQADFGSTDRAFLLSAGSLFRFGQSGNITFNLVPKIGWFYFYGDMELGSVYGKYSTA